MHRDELLTAALAMREIARRKSRVHVRTPRPAHRPTGSANQRPSAGNNSIAQNPPPKSSAMLAVCAEKSLQLSCGNRLFKD